MNPESVQIVMESHDRTGAADHDVPYTFGRRPNVSHPYPFSIREYARLLVLRGRYRDAPGEPSEDLPLAA